MQGSKLEKAFINIIKIGLWFLPVLPLYVSSSLLFPFITGKNFTFRIVVEIIFAFWLGAVVAWPRYRLRLTPLVKFSTIFMVILFLADLFSPNPVRSFFSNYERMEGFMMLFHLYLYFLMLVSVFRTKRDWLIFFHSTLIASLIVSYMGLLQKLGYRISLQGGFRVDSTIGNPTYLAAYLFFHVWILVSLMYHFWKNIKKFWTKIILTSFYTLALFFELMIIFFTATRGATVALVATSFLFVLGLVIFWPKIFSHSKRGRGVAAVLLLLVILIPTFFWSIRESKFVSSTPNLYRLANFSFRERTIQSRFSIWNMSLKGVMERPLLGWGQENYYLVFQKYYDPKLYSSEPWFDRSHNIILDWLIHTGVLGLASFFLIIGAVFWLLWKGIRQGRLNLWEGMVLLVIFLGYLIQNIFVFDNLNTYLLFFALIAYTDHLTSSEEVLAIAPSKKRSLPPNPVGRVSPILGGGLGVNRALLISTVTFSILFVLGYYLHIKPISASKDLLAALRIENAGGAPDQVWSAFRSALSYNTFGNTEVREQMANLARKIPTDERLSPEKKIEFFSLVIDELKKEVNRPAKDIKHMLFLASILSAGASLKPEYMLEAETLLKDAITLSPRKQIIHFELAQLYLRQGRKEEAVGVLESAVKLEPNFTQAKANLLVAAAIAGQANVIEGLKNKIEFRDLPEDSLSRLGQIYRSVNDITSAKDVYGELIKIAPQNPQYHAFLAALLGASGEIDRAREETKKAIELDSSFAKEGETFLKILEEQRKNGLK